jgi:quinohemoprotein ethanol dehydrogenase
VLGGALGGYPNLWNLAPSTWGAFDAIVLGGAFREAGMANFSDVLSRSDAGALKAFIIDDEVKRRALGELPAPGSAVAAH